MKKLISTLIVLCITVAALIVGQPVQAKRNLEKGQEAINQLMQYVDTPNKKNNNANVEETHNESMEEDPEERVQ